MKITQIQTILAAATLMSVTDCFTMTNSIMRQSSWSTLSASIYFMDEVVESKEVKAGECMDEKMAPVEKQISARKVPKKNPGHKEGVFSPLVLATKSVIGIEKLNKLRGKVISIHSDVIGKFVETYETPLGERILSHLFAAIDSNEDGTLDNTELKKAFEVLGFTWLQEKQVNGIVKRADKDGNGVIDLDEFRAELPKTLRTNLIKLAKKNGADMGLLV